MDKPSGIETPDPKLNHEKSALPEAGIGEILGLVEFLISKGGKEDIYKLAAELKMEFGDMLHVIRGAELIGLVHTPGGDVVIEPLGEKISKARLSSRKGILRDPIAKLPLFSSLMEFLKSQEEQKATRDQILERITEMLPNENCERIFSTLVAWGRYAEIFGYNDDTQTFYIDHGTDETAD